MGWPHRMDTSSPANLGQLWAAAAVHPFCHWGIDSSWHIHSHCFEKLIIDSTIFVGHTFVQTTLLTSIPWFYDPKKVRDREKAVVWQTMANRVFEMRGPLCHGHGWFVRQHCGIITQFSSNYDRTLWWCENAELVAAKWLLDISRRRNWIFWMQSWVCSITRVFTAACQHGIDVLRNKVFQKQTRSYVAVDPRVIPRS